MHITPYIHAYTLPQTWSSTTLLLQYAFFQTKMDSVLLFLAFQLKVYFFSSYNLISMLE
uniref:Uncharacterized protein n=1 Tax=Octopus bimaculoides TaxID=37653 RepID=A0A0L8FFD3_OCTBM